MTYRIKRGFLVLLAAGLLAGCDSAGSKDQDSGRDAGPDIAIPDAPAGEIPDAELPTSDPGQDSPGGDVPTSEIPGDTYDPAANDPEFLPWMVRLSTDIDPIRNWIVHQGHLHAHSVFSHDACDNMPRQNGETGPRNEECFWDLRRDICTSGLDFLFLTDHMAMFPDYEFPDVLLFEDGQDDDLVVRNGDPVANRIGCPDGRRVLVSAGLDRHWLAVGLERHVGDTPEERKANYQTANPETFLKLRQNGALITTAYSSEWDEDKLLSHAWDGYEVYNPATNMREKIAEIAMALGMMAEDPDSVPVPELSIVAFFEEGETNLRYWSKLVQKRPVFNFIGPNAHRNAFAMEMTDGERMDSYRRIFRWYGNFLLIPGGSGQVVDDRTYVDAMAAGRLYNAFLFFGYPVGFDFHARVNETIFEMGAQIPSIEQAELVVRVPRLYGRLPEGVEHPVITAHVLRAMPDGTWESVASGQQDFTYNPDAPGVYRADVRIVPRHLVPWLGRTPEPYLTERSWVFSNPIYLGMTWNEDQ